MNKTSWIIFVAVVVVLFGALVFWTRSNTVSIDVSDVDPNSVIAASEMNGEIGDQLRGNAESKVVLVEYGDFQCPSCAAAHPHVNTLIGEYGDDIAFIYRQFPLVSIHPNARAASGAAEAAGLQGKYWEMHNNLFYGQNNWNNLDSTQRTNLFVTYARDLGLDEDQFKEDLASDRVNRKISFDQALGKKQGVTATPTFFLNGEKLDEEVANSFINGDLTGIKEAIDEALK